MLAPGSDSMNRATAATLRNQMLQLQHRSHQDETTTNVMIPQRTLCEAEQRVPVAVEGRAPRPKHWVHAGRVKPGLLHHPQHTHPRLGRRL